MGASNNIFLDNFFSDKDFSVLTKKYLNWYNLGVETLHSNCKKLLVAYRAGNLGQTKMPEDSNPGFSDKEWEMRLAYFTLPMALNYQRNSYTLWESALKTWQDEDTRKVFDIVQVSKMSEEDLRRHLTKYKLALQPNKHIATWKMIAKTIYEEWGSFADFIKSAKGDFLNLKDLVQDKHKKGFPYLSGPKIFNYWSFILGEYGKVQLKNKEYIEIAPDTHVTQCSVLLGVITHEEAEKLSKDQISEKWRTLLNGSGIAPIEMHPPLWFWSRNGFIYKLED
jgi:3-methyladenine DNA glycosylase Tag